MPTGKICKKCGEKVCQCLQNELRTQMKEAHLPPGEEEYPFALEIGRKWRADFAWPAIMLLVEIEGGVWQKSGHQSPIAFMEDCEKNNNAALLGYYVLRFTERQIYNYGALRMIEEFMRIHFVQIVRPPEQERRTIRYPAH